MVGSCVAAGDDAAAALSSEQPGPFERRSKLTLEVGSGSEEARWLEDPVSEEHSVAEETHSRGPAARHTGPQLRTAADDEINPIIQLQSDLTTSVYSSRLCHPRLLHHVSHVTLRSQP